MSNKTNQELSNCSISELREKAKKCGLKNYESKSRSELEKELERNQ